MGSCPLSAGLLRSTPQRSGVGSPALTARMSNFVKVLAVRGWLLTASKIMLYYYGRFSGEQRE
jgi:hypothetical protein